LVKYTDQKISATSLTSVIFAKLCGQFVVDHNPVIDCTTVTLSDKCFYLPKLYFLSRNISRKTTCFILDTHSQAFI